MTLTKRTGIGRLSLCVATATLVIAAVPLDARQVRARSRTSVNRNYNVNRNVNVNVNRDVNVHGAYYGGYHGGYYGPCCYHDYHPVATAAAVTATAMVTAAVIGSIVHTLPSGCTSVMVNGFAYQQCGSTWYQPQISGGSTTYIVVNPPR
jgi:hypothetical protein